jgi:hypothetical protein
VILTFFSKKYNTALSPTELSALTPDHNPTLYCKVVWKAAPITFGTHIDDVCLVFHVEQNEFVMEVVSFGPQCYKLDKFLEIGQVYWMKGVYAATPVPTTTTLPNNKYNLIMRPYSQLMKGLIYML